MHSDDDLRQCTSAPEPARETEALRRTRLRILYYLRQLRGEACVEVLPDLRLHIPLPNGEVLVDVHPAGHEDGLVRFVAVLGSPPNPQPDVLVQLLRANHRETLVGAYALDEEHRPVFRHHVLGGALDRDGIRVILETFETVTRGRPVTGRARMDRDTAPGVPDPTVPMETRPWLDPKHRSGPGRR
ncbi:MAG: type III secretion system chaperone [Pseudomonadota bacterium]